MMDGWKTHIAAALVAAVAIVEGLLGVDVPGAEMQADWLTYVLGAFGLSAIRDAMRKIGM